MEEKKKNKINDGCRSSGRSFEDAKPTCPQLHISTLLAVTTARAIARSSCSRATTGSSPPPPLASTLGQPKANIDRNRPGKGRKKKKKKEQDLLYIFLSFAPPVTFSPWGRGAGEPRPLLWRVLAGYKRARSPSSLGLSAPRVFSASPRTCTSPFRPSVVVKEITCGVESTAFLPSKARIIA